MYKISDIDFCDIMNDKAIDFEMLKNKTFLISGGSGFIPSYIILFLLALNKVGYGIKIIALVRNMEKAKIKFNLYLNDRNLILVNHDVINCYDGAEFKIDFIIHAASLASPKYFLTKPCDIINTNCIGTFNMLKLAYEKKVKSFLFFSSGEVNGDIYDKVDYVNESNYGSIDPLIVRNCYAESKRMGESLCSCWNYQYDIPAKIVRPSHTYGPGVDPDDERAFASIINSVKNEKDIILKSDGSAKRSFCYLSDATRAYINILLNGKSCDAYNVSNSYQISIKELAELAVSVSKNRKLKIIYNNDELISSNPSSTQQNANMDITKIRNLGWVPRVNEREGLRRIFFEAN